MFSYITGFFLCLPLKKKEKNWKTHFLTSFIFMEYNLEKKLPFSYKVI